MRGQAISEGLAARLLTGPDVWFTVVLVVTAVVSKIVGCGLGARAAGFTYRESLRLGMGMVSRGEVGLIVASVGVGIGFVKSELFAVVTLIVLVTTLVTPPLLRLAFAGKEVSRA